MAIDINELQTELARATEEVVEARGNLLDAGVEHRNHKRGLEAACATGLLDGSITGKNQTERDARAREVYSDQFEQVEELEHGYEAAKHDLAIAELRLQLARDKIRLLEVAISIQRSG